MKKRSTVKQLFFTFCILIFLSCHHKPEKINIVHIFNPNEKLYTVYHIQQDSVDASGIAYKSVEFRNENGESYFSEGVMDYKIGDSVYIGHNPEGEYMVSLRDSAGK